MSTFIIPSDMTPDEALNLIVALEARFAFAYAVFTREDVGFAYETTFLRPMGDAEWEAFRVSWAWRKGIGEAMSERGWETITFGLDDAFDADGNVKPE